MSYRIDLHVHSCYSVLDGMMSPRAIVKLATKHGYDAIAVTDHYTYDGAVRGTLATKALADDTELTAYTGLEYHVTTGPHRGHVLVYFDDASQVPARGLTLDALMDHCHDHGLSVTHPHPYGFAGITSTEFMRQADHIEINGSYGAGEVNERLVEETARLGLDHKLVANSDAHARGQIGSAYTQVAELHPHVGDTLATVEHCGLGEPRRTWGRAAKVARAIAQPVGLVMNGIQRLSTWRALESRDVAIEIPG